MRPSLKMRRALQAAGPLLLRSTSAESACRELCATRGPALAAAAGGPGGGGGGGSGGGSIISPPWALSSQVCRRLATSSLDCEHADMQI